MAVVWLELRVQILMAVDLVGEGVDTVAIISIIIDKLNCHLVGSNLKQIVLK